MFVNHTLDKGLVAKSVELQCDDKKTQDPITEWTGNLNLTFLKGRLKNKQKNPGDT